MKIILASKSPRRREILEMSQIEFKVLTLNVVEHVEESDPKKYVELTAKKKGLAAVNELPNDLILSCDTIVVLDDEILEKPKNKDDAYRMIKKLSGRSHYVYTGVYLASKVNCFEKCFHVETKVNVSELTENEIINYINTDEPYDKAGGYAIQGLFGKHIEGIEGDYFNVVGLPINEIYKHLKEYNNLTRGII